MVKIFETSEYCVPNFSGFGSNEQLFFHFNFQGWLVAKHLRARYGCDHVVKVEVYI